MSGVAARQLPTSPAGAGLLQTFSNFREIIMAKNFIQIVRSSLQAAAASLLVASGLSFAAVDANKASQAELESVKGVGPALSAKIIDARKAGAFASWADLVDRVSGVGPSSASRLASNGLTVNGQGFEGSGMQPAGKQAGHHGKGEAGKGEAGKVAKVAR
jgi:competence protein ComEA